KHSILYTDRPTTALFFRFQGQVFGYVNSCPHQGSELDWEGQVFTRAGDLLMCARHGATFLPNTGECIGGPCKSSRLIPLSVHEADHNGIPCVYWTPSAKISPAA